MFYIARNEVITIKQVLDIVEKELENTFDLAFDELFGNDIKDRYPFLMDGSFEIIQAHIRPCVLTWFREKIFENVSVCIVDDITKISDGVFIQMNELRTQQNIKDAFKTALGSVQKQISSVFENKWMESVKQGAMKTDFERRNKDMMKVMVQQLNALLPPKEESSAVNTPASSVTPQLDLPSAPTHSVVIPSRQSTEKRKAVLSMFCVS